MENVYSTVEQILYSNYVKYSRLQTIIGNEFKNSPANKIHVYVDLYSMLKSLFNKNNYVTEDYIAISSSVLNLVAHMRKFFRNFGINSDFYLVWSSNRPMANNQFYKDYNIANQPIGMGKDLLNKNIEALSILIPYIESVHFINTSFESSVVIYDYILRNECIDNSPNLVITKDPYAFQLVSMGVDTRVLRPYKSKGEDCSYIINKSNLYKALIHNRKSKVEELPTIHHGLYSLLLALTSVPERGIKSLLNMRTGFDVLNKSIDNFVIANRYNSSNEIQNVYNSMQRFSTSLKKTDFIILNNRFKAIDIAFQHSLFMNSDEYNKINASLQDLYDPETVKEINNTYFYNKPIDLNNI